MGISQSSFYDYYSGVREWPQGKFEIIVEALGTNVADLTRLAGIVAGGGVTTTIGWVSDTNNTITNC